jgi:hypothetical protein
MIRIKICQARVTLPAEPRRLRDVMLVRRHECHRVDISKYDPVFLFPTAHVHSEMSC